MKGITEYMYSKQRLIFNLLVGRILSNIALTIHSIQNVIFDDRNENDTIGVEVVSHFFFEKGHTTGHTYKKRKRDKNAT